MVEYKLDTLKGGWYIGIDVDTFDFQAVVGLFWKTTDGKWRGVLKENCSETRVDLIRGDDFILVIKPGDDESSEP
ncbi:MAG TPA: hypothetical protein GXX58_11730 [Gelria sp.]|nr:hypothetical protein [Gelria sp.]